MEQSPPPRDGSRAGEAETGVGTTQQGEVADTEKEVGTAAEGAGWGQGRARGRGCGAGHHSAPLLRAARCAPRPPAALARQPLCVRRAGREESRWGTAEAPRSPTASAGSRPRSSPSPPLPPPTPGPSSSHWAASCPRPAAHPTPPGAGRSPPSRTVPSSCFPTPSPGLQGGENKLKAEQLRDSNKLPST